MVLLPSQVMQRYAHYHPNQKNNACKNVAEKEVHAATIPNALRRLGLDGSSVILFMCLMQTYNFIF
tara:strand:- start:4717 stop:4914 length:198 start_codon:yes stop_codon:yes gene_type:complete